jgi:deazaflavin-dependent oxidoreductase (nitroreductase family)
LATTGRHSGLLREIEIWFAADASGDRMFMLSGGGEAAHWVQNLRIQPRVQVRVGDRAFDGRARVVDPDEPADAEARAAIAAKYGTTGLQRWLRESLPVEIVLEPAAGG